MALFNYNDNQNNNNGGYTRPVVSNNYSRFVAEDILDEVSYYVQFMIDNNAPGDYLISQLMRMETEGKIQIVGHGTNRKVLKINADMRNTLNRIGFVNASLPVLVKVPFNIYSGRMDNIREAFAWYFMQKERSSYVRDAAAQKGRR